MEILRKIIRAVVSLFDWIFSVFGSAAYRFYWDDCFSRAAALAYTTLFALVPITVVAFSLVSGFGVAGEQLSITLKAIIEQLLPTGQNIQLQELHQQVLTYLQAFSDNARALNVVSAGVLIFTSVALINTIESALNVVWRTTSSMTILSKLLSFLGVILLGPFLIGISIFWTTKVRLMGLGDNLALIDYFAISYAAPVIVTSIALTLLFYKLPAAKVSLRDAVLGAVVAAILFEWIKRAFAYYVGVSTTYSAIYGVLATLPLFLFWLYVAWLVVLFGAEVSYQAGSIHILKGLRRYATELGEVGGVLGLRILLVIGRNFIEGKTPPTEGELAIECGSDPVLVRSCLNVLADANIISAPDEKSHVRALIVAPQTITVGQVFQFFRSKRHRYAAAESGMGLLEIVRNISSRLDKPIESWTLEELLSS